MKYTFLILAFILSCYTTFSQETHLDQTEEQLYVEIMNAFDEALYGRAISLAERYTSQKSHLNKDHIPTDQIKIELVAKISALRLEIEGAHLELENYALSINPDHLANQAFYELGNYYYNEKIYESAIHYFGRTNVDHLDELEYTEATFKLAYSHFVLKEFATAERYLVEVKDVQNIYFYPINYYYGMVKYFNRDYDAAVKSFERVSSSTQYRPHIPYYIAQIYFAQGKMNELTIYGERAIKEPETRKIKEIRLLLGQAYYLEGNYKDALPHLEYYEANTSKLTKDEFYQLAFTQYQLGKCESAISNFKELTNLDTKQGQLVNYYLADCYVKTKDMVSARAAFKKVSQMPYEVSMQEEALYNYGKLSAELGQDREAINTLVKVEKSSPYYEQSKPIINDILVNTDDYVNAISIIESLDELTPELRQTYQMLTLKRGIQLYQEGNKSLAEATLSKSLSINEVQSYNVRAQYWKAKMLYEQEDYRQSITAFNTYFEMSNGVNGLPEASSPYIANYIQGYNHLQLKEYNSAEIRFKNAIVGINLDREDIKSEYILDRVLNDALVRAGDMAFTSNKYYEAEKYYDQAIDRKQSGYVYSLYQKAMIEGLTGRPYEKIITLEEIINNHPQSEYVDESMMQMGDTYLALGNTSSAGSAFTDLIVRYYGKSPYINAALLKKGLISYNRGDMPEALKFYKRVFTNNPAPQESQAALIAIEEIYVDDLKKADAYFTYLDSIPKYRITDFEKDSLTYVIAEKQYLNSNYDAAIEDLTNYIEKFANGSHSLDAHYMRGESLSILGRYGAANADYEYVIDQGYSNYYESALRKAALINYNHIQDFKQSYKYYDLLVSETQSTEIQYDAQLGALRSAFRIFKDDAVLKYGQLVAESNYSSKEEKLAAKYYIAKVSYKRGLTDQALIAFEYVAKQGTNNQSAEARYMLAKMFYDQKDMELAEVAVNNANTNNSGYPYWVAKGLILLSDIYIANSDLFNARAAIEAVIENFKSDNTILSEAQSKLKALEKLEDKTSRIKENNDSNTLELDTTGTGN